MSKYDAQYEAWKKKKAEEAQAASSAKRDQYEKQYQEWKAKQDNSATNHAEIIQKRVNNWISNNNNYVTNYKNRFANRTGSYKDAYADNAEGWLTDTQRHKAQLDQDAEDILSMLDTYGDQLDADWVKDVRNVMSEARKNQGSILDAFTADRDYWAQFDSKDIYADWQRYQELQDTEAMGSKVGELEPLTTQRWEEAQAAEKAYRDAAAKLQTPDRRLTDEEYAAAEAELDELFNTMHEANAQYNRAKTDLDYYSYYYGLAKEKHDLEALPEGYAPELAAKGWESYTADQARKQVEKAEDAALKGLANLFAGVSDTSGFAVATREMATGFREDTSYKEPSEKWTDAQRNKFGYLYQQNPQAAEEYAIKINDAIAREEQEGVISGIQANASSGFWPGLGHSGVALAAGGLGIADFYVDLLEYGARGRITEKPGVTPFEYSQAVTSGISQKLNEKGTLDEDLFAIGGKGWGDLYSLGMSAAQSMLSAYTLGGTGSMVQFFGSAAASGVDDAKQRGATDEQALIYGTLMGAAEAYAEKCGIDNLLSLSPGETVRQLITNILKQGAQEGMEEGLTSVLGGVADQLVLGDNSNFNALVRQYRADGMSAEEAKRQAWKDTAGDVIFDAIGGAFTGAVSGGVHTGIATAVQNYQDTKSGKKIVETKGGTDALMQLAREMAEREYGSTKETINTLAEKAGAGDARSAGKLLRTVEAAAYKRNQSEIAKGLQDNGISAKQAKEIAEAVNASLAGFRITEKQTQLLEAVASDERVTSAVDRVLGSGRSGVLQRTRMLNNFAQKLESGKQTADSAAAQQAQAQAENTATGDNVTTTEKTAPEGGYEVSTEGQTVLKESEAKGFVGGYSGTTYNATQADLLASVSTEGLQNAADLSGRQDVTFAHIGISDQQTKQEWLDAGLAYADHDADGNEIYVVNDAMLLDERSRRHKAEMASKNLSASAVGEAIRKDDGSGVTIVDFADAQQGQIVFNTTSGMVKSEDVNLNSATKMAVEMIVRMGASTEDANIMFGAFKSGDAIQKAKALSNAYGHGKGGGTLPSLKQSGLASLLTEEQMKTAHEAGRKAAKKMAADHTLAQDARQTKKTWRKGNVKGYGVTTKDLNEAFQLNKMQRSAYKILAKIAEVTGVDIVLYKSELGDDGKFHAGVIDGINLEGKSGAFNWANDKIYIDINAGLETSLDMTDLTKYTMLRTFGHEFTHFLEKYNAVDYVNFRELVFQTMERNGENPNEMVRAILSENSGWDYDRASREVVAEAMVDITGDSHFTEELANRHKGLFETFIDQLKGFLENIKQHFNALLKSADVGSGLKEQIGDGIHYLEEIVEAYDKMAVRAVERYQETRTDSAEVIGNTRYSDFVYSDGNVQGQSAGGYDYTKSFAAQIADYQSGNFPVDDTLMLGGTPDVLKKIGLIGLPMTINQKHIKDALNGTYKGTPQEKLDHTFTAQELATLPQKIADPIAIIHDKRIGKVKASESTIDVLVEMTVASGKKVIAAVQINGNGRLNGIRVDTNKVATVHGNSDAVARLVDAINENEKGSVALFYINNDKTTKVLQRTGNPIPSGLSDLDGFIHSIFDPGSPVKVRFSSVTETLQFKRWFGDWQNHPENASKVVNDDGTPKVVYHGSYQNFSVFDGTATKHSKAPSGAHFFTDNMDVGYSYTGYKNVAKPGGNAYQGGVYPVYLNMKNPYVVDFAGHIWSEKINGMDVNETAQYAKDNGYDGVIAYNIIDEGGYGDQNWDEGATKKPATDYIVFDSTQIKSATDNIGTFDGNNPDIRYQQRRQQLSDRDVLDQAEQTVGNRLNEIQKNHLGVFRKQYGKVKELDKRLLAERAKLARHEKAGDRDEAIKTRNRIATLERMIEREAGKLREFESKDIFKGIIQAARPVIEAERLAKWKEQYGIIPEGENPIRDDSLPASTDGKNKVSRTARTVKGAVATTDEFADLIDAEVANGGLTYIPITNDATSQKARARIERLGWDDAKAMWSADIRNGKTGAEMAAMGAMLLNNAAQVGDKEAWLDILYDYQMMGTNTAQALQALRILKKLKPEDKLYMIRRSVRQMVDDMRLGVDIQVDENLQKQYREAKTEKERDAVLGEIAQNVADQIPSTALDKWTALRYVNMLGNPRTQVRNVVGNLGMSAVVEIKNTMAAGLEAMASLMTRGRFGKTKSIHVNKDLLKAARKDFDSIKALILDGGKYSDSKAESLEFAKRVQEKRRIFSSDNKVLDKVLSPMERYRVLTNEAMEKGDLIFSQASYARALAGYLQARGIKNGDLSSVNTALLDEARVYAVREAQEATFRDTNTLSKWVSQAGRRRGTPKAVRVISEGIMPFRKTPANILVRAIEYSPMGVVDSVVKSIQAMQEGSEVSGADVINSWAKALTGTGLFGLGMLLANLGLLVGGPDDDDDQDYFDQMNGWQNYAIVLPDGTNFTIDFLSPAAMPMFMGAQLMTLMQEGGIKAKDIETALLSIADPMIQMSMLQGINDTLENIQYAESNFGQFLINAMLSYTVQGMTNTWLGQLERTFEGQRNTTYVDDESAIPVWLQRTLGKASAKIPGWDHNQISYINAWGEEEVNPAWYLNAIYNMLSPSYMDKGKEDAVSAELTRLNDVQSDVNVLPNTPGKKLTYTDVDGVLHEDYNLSAEEYVALATKQGQTQRQLVEKMIGLDLYEDLPDHYKAKVIGLAYDYAREYAQIDVLDRDGFSSDWMAEIEGDTATGIVQHVIKENIKGMYLTGDISSDEAIRRRVAYCGDTQSDAEEKVAYWDFQRENEEYSGFDESMVKKFNEIIKPVGIDLDTYYQFRQEASKCTGEQDADGETIDGSVKAEKLELIDALPLTRKQKDALYLAEGWAESKLYQAPWH